MKLVSLISSGIDSPVATYLLSNYTDEIILVHGDIKPFTSNQENENFLKIANYLKIILKCKIRINIIPHGSSLKKYKNNCNNRFTCIFCKRMLLRYAEIIANNNKPFFLSAKAIPQRTPLKPNIPKFIKLIGNEKIIAVTIPKSEPKKA